MGVMKRGCTSQRTGQGCASVRCRRPLGADRPIRVTVRGSGRAMLSPAAGVRPRDAWSLSRYRDELPVIKPIYLIVIFIREGSSPISATLCHKFFKYSLEAFPGSNLVIAGSQCY